MKISGIIAEYNPFHNGHKYHIDKVRDNGADGIVAVMSGNFVQRGEPAIEDKYQRAKSALIGGVDLVLELPSAYATSSAEIFAKSGVDILNRLGCVDEISFGAEEDNILSLKKIAAALQNEDTDNLLKEKLKEGISYPTALDYAVGQVIGMEYSVIMRQPNNILAIEYLKALNRSESQMTPFAVKRAGCNHDSDTPIGNIASASFIRDNLRIGKTDVLKDYMPATSESILKGNIEKGDALIDLDIFEKAVLSKLRFLPLSYFSKLPDVSEGIENRLHSAIAISRTLDELYGYVKTKRYTHSRIRRLILQAFLGISAKDITGEIPYVRVLGFNDVGRSILKEMKFNATIPVIMKASDIADLHSDKADRIFNIECRGSDQYFLFTPTVRPCGTDKTANIIRL
jgi:predicted nucleotidyltransferase